jgi:hypothetical protein
MHFGYIPAFSPSELFYPAFVKGERGKNIQRLVTQVASKVAISFNPFPASKRALTSINL